jgi:hypothetical protein
MHTSLLKTNITLTASREIARFPRIHRKLPATLGHDPTVGRRDGKPRKHHRWYRETFKDYPAKRRALIPFLL